jgi:hypothetical protein
MIYMWAIPLAIPAYKDIVFDGLVVYPNRSHPISSINVDESFVRKITSLAQAISADVPCLKFPSFHECKYCKIAKSECPERIEGGGSDEEFSETDEFGEIATRRHVSHLPPPAAEEIAAFPAHEYRPRPPLHDYPPPGNDDPPAADSQQLSARIEELARALQSTERWCEELQDRIKKLETQAARTEAIEAVL